VVAVRSAVLQCHVEGEQQLLLLAGIGARFQANPPEMSRKAVAQQVPFLGYGYSAHFETLKSRSRERLFRGV